MAGQLFTHYFLTEGIQATSDWRNLISQSDTFEAFRGGIRQFYEGLIHDIRKTDPNKNQHRKARFREGWHKVTIGKKYTDDTLEDLTWENLGFRLGSIIGSTKDDLINELYDWCVEQHAEAKKA